MLDADSWGCVYCEYAAANERELQAHMEKYHPALSLIEAALLERELERVALN